jgi:hypothetical protein
MTSGEIRQSAMRGSRDHSEHVDSVPPSNGRAIGAHQPRAGAIPAVLLMADESNQTARDFQFDPLSKTRIPRELFRGHRGNLYGV